MPATLEQEPQTFAAFEGRVSDNTIKGVSLIHEGPALTHKHHGFQVVVDQKALQEFQRIAKAQGRIKVKFNHHGVVQDSVGYAQNFRIRGSKLLADVTLFKAHPSKELLLEMAEEISGQFGVSLLFNYGEPEWDAKLESFAVRPQEIFSADFVDIPAANPTGVFSAEIDSGADDMPADPAPATVTLEAFEAYKSENDAKTAKIAALEAEVAALKESKQPEPVKQEPTALSAELAEVRTLLKAFAVAPPTKQEPAPANEQEQPEPPKAFSAARAEAIGTATGLSRISKARAFDASYPSEAAYLASFKK